jgi:hypothetical protein
MDAAKIKIEFYDFFALFLPGLLVLCEGWGTVVGWNNLWASIQNLNLFTGSVFFFLAFAVGQLVQELGDWTIKKFCGPRFFAEGRDQVMEGALGNLVRERIQQELKQTATTLDADACFDYCLTRVGARFVKRDFFLTTSDLCRGLFVAAVIAGFLTCVGAVQDIRNSWWRALQLLVGATGSALLAWTRMRRFRKLSEAPLFRIFLAVVSEEMTKSTSRP